MRRHPRIASDAVVPFEDARNVCVSRTYAFIAARQTENRQLKQILTADGKLTNARDLKIGMVDASAFAFVADGRNVLRGARLFTRDEVARLYLREGKPFTVPLDPSK